MRFDKRITFVNEAGAYYNPITGEYTDAEQIKETLPCNLSTMGVDRTNELFGQIDKVITVARLQRPYTGKIDYVLINDKKYNVKRQSDYRKGVFYLEGVSSNG